MATNIAPPVSIPICFRPESIVEKAADRPAGPGFSAARLLLAAALLVGTLAFGGVQAWSWGLIAVLGGLAFISWTWASTRYGVLRVVWTPLYLPGAGLFLLGLIQFTAHLTADPIATRESLVKLGSNLVIFFLAGQVWQSPDANRRFAASVVSFTSLLALFAILQFFAGPATIYGIVRPRWGGWVFGPYVNHNHYAGLMEMLIPITLCYLVSLRGPGAGARRVLTAFAAVVALASLLLCGSRGGLVSLTGELVVMGLILWRGLSARRRAWGSGAAVLGVAAVVLLFLWLDPGQISKRLGSMADVPRTPDASFIERRVVARDSLRIFHDHPWRGTGLGTFATVYPRYRSFASDLEWDHAHNDYAEALAETGIAGGVVILSALAGFFVLTFQNLDERLESVSGWISLGAALGCCGLLVHGLADFNFHIPANAAWFSVAAGLATAPLPPPQNDNAMKASYTSNSLRTLPRTHGRTLHTENITGSLYS